jgi:predicted nucleic acid-binding protein
VIVLDASVVVDFLLATPPHFEAIAARLTREEDLAAPHLLDAEVGQVLRRFALANEITAERGEAALEDLDALGLIRFPHGPLMKRAFALRRNATTYDALYLVLAESLGATLLTRDTALANIPGHRASVELLG